MACLLAQPAGRQRPFPTRRTEPDGIDRRVQASSGGRLWLSSAIVSSMATEKEVLRIGGREVTVTNPRKVYFPETGHTKLDLINYYQSVAAGALRGAGG